MTLPNYDPTPSYIVFGATGGIGSALCRRLAKDGARLVIASRSAEKTELLAEELHALPFTLDARNSEEVSACVDFAKNNYSRVDGVVNCIGNMLLKPAHITSHQEWDDVIGTNLTTAFHVLQSSARTLSNQGGSIVLMSSVAGRVGLANHEAIAAAKAGVIGLTLSAAATYANKGVRVNCVAPGLVRTPMTRKLTENESARKISEAMHPLGRIGDPNDIVSAIYWLLSAEQSWVTGQVLSVDGGLSFVRPRS